MEAEAFQFKRALKAPFLICPAASVTAAAALAHLDRGRLAWAAAVGVLIGVIALHAGANLLYAFSRTGRSNGADSRPGRPLALLTGGLIAVSLGLLIGLALALTGRPQAAWWSLIGLALAALYTLNPFSLRQRVASEILVFLLAGPLLTTAVYHVLTGRISPLAACLGLPLGALTAAAAWLSHIINSPEDQGQGRRNPAMVLGVHWTVLVYLVVALAAFAYLPVLAFGYGLGWLVMAGLAPLPLLVSAALILIGHHWARGQVDRVRAKTAQTQAIMGFILAAALAVESFFRS